MSERRIVVILGSPRENGNSATLARRVIAGAREAGAAVESYYIHGMGIKPCSACDACQGSIEAECVIDDGMQEVYQALRAADAIVIASPIYWFSVSAQTKAFLDRCYALGGPEGSALKGKRIGIVLTYEDPDPFISGAANALRSFQDMFSYVGATIDGMIYGTASAPGEISANTELMDRAHRLGRELAS